VAQHVSTHVRPLSWRAVGNWALVRSGSIWLPNFLWKKNRRANYQYHAYFPLLNQYGRKCPRAINNSATLSSSRNESGTRLEGTKAVLASSSIRFLPLGCRFIKSCCQFDRPMLLLIVFPSKRIWFFPLHLFRCFAISVRPISHSIPFFFPKWVRHKTRTRPVLLVP
jgi:hypothetical protein